MAKNSTGDYPELTGGGPDQFWTNPSVTYPYKYTDNTGTLPFVDDQRQLDQLTEHLKQLQQQQQQLHNNSYVNMNYHMIDERLRKIEEMTETLFNMLKLILTTQLEKEMKDKERAKEESPQDVVS